MISITIQNGDSADVFVTVTDNDSAPASEVMNNQRLNYASAPVQLQITENAAGRGNIDWKAVRCDDATIYNQSNAAPSDGDLVFVSAG
jgi:hypothetical protein